MNLRYFPLIFSVFLRHINQNEILAVTINRNLQCKNKHYKSDSKQVFIEAVIKFCSLLRLATPAFSIFAWSSRRHASKQKKATPAYMPTGASTQRLNADGPLQNSLTLKIYKNMQYIRKLGYLNFSKPLKKIKLIIFLTFQVVIISINKQLKIIKYSLHLYQ